MDIRAILSAACFPVLLFSGTLVYNSCATHDSAEVKPKTEKAAPTKVAASSPGAQSVVDKSATLEPSKKTAAKPLTPAKPRVLPPPPKLNAQTKVTGKAPASPNVKTEVKVVKLEEKKAAVGPVAVALKTEKVEKAEKVTRFVAVNVLNVRSKPSTSDSAIVGKLVKGSQLPVEIKGEWARVGDAQWVQTKFLSPNPGRAMAAK